MISVESGFAIPKTNTVDVTLCKLMKNALKQADALQWPIFMPDSDFRATPKTRQSAMENLEATRRNRSPA
jgi:hypothetical protein